MKYTLSILAVAVSVAVSGVAVAGDINSTSDSRSTSLSGASNEGNNQTIIFQNPEQRELTRQFIDTTGNQTINYSGEYKLKNVPSMASPNLTTSNDTCMGSVSGSVAVPGFGIGGGSTVIDENCVMLKNSRELWNMGMRAAAMARMCMDAKNREALEVTGFVCPKTEEVRKQEIRKDAQATNNPYASNY